MLCRSLAGAAAKKVGLGFSVQGRRVWVCEFMVEGINGARAEGLGFCSMSVLKRGTTATRF